MSDEQLFTLIEKSVSLLLAVFFLSGGVSPQAVITASVDSPKNGDVVEYHCSSENLGGDLRFWINNRTGATLCDCLRDNCVAVGSSSRFSCSANEKTITLTIKSFNSTLDNFPLMCQFGSDSSVFEPTPARNTGSFQDQNIYVGAIVAGIVGGLSVVLLLG